MLKSPLTLVIEDFCCCCGASRHLCLWFGHFMFGLKIYVQNEPYKLMKNQQTSSLFSYTVNRSMDLGSGILLFCLFFPFFVSFSHSQFGFFCLFFPFSFGFFCRFTLPSIISDKKYIKFTLFHINWAISQAKRSSLSNSQ